MLTQIIDRFRSMDLLSRKKPLAATELSRLLLRKVREEGVVTMNWELAVCLGAGRKLLYRTAYQLVIKESISMLSDPDLGILLMTNAEFNRFLARRGGWTEEEVVRHYGRHESPIRAVPLHEEAGETGDEAALAGETVTMESPEPAKVAAMLSETEQLSLGGVMLGNAYRPEALSALPDEALHDEQVLTLPKEPAAAKQAGRSTQAFLRRIVGRVFGKAKGEQSPASELYIDSDPGELGWFDLEIGAADRATHQPEVAWPADKGDNLPEGDNMPEGPGKLRQSFPNRGRELWDEKEFSEKNRG